MTAEQLSARTKQEHEEFHKIWDEVSKELPLSIFNSPQPREYAKTAAWKVYLKVKRGGE